MNHTASPLAAQHARYPEVFRAPGGFPQRPLHFKVFIAGSNTPVMPADPVDRHLKEAAQAAVLALSNEYGPKVKLEAVLGSRDTAQPSSVGAQSDIDPQLLSAHIVIGVLGERLGHFTRQELLSTLQDKGPVQAAWLFYAQNAFNMDETAPAELKLQRLHCHGEILNFVREWESPTDEGDVRSCHAFARREDLAEELKRRLRQFVNGWLDLCEAKPAGEAPAAPSAATPASPPAMGMPKYLGLQPYGRKDAADFFGRTQEISELQTLLHTPGKQVLWVRGASGVGKSSLVFAGLLPRLQRASASPAKPYFFMVPKQDPFASLAEGLLKRGARVPMGMSAELLGAELARSTPAELVRKLLQVLPPSGLKLLYIDQLEELIITAGEDDADTVTRRGKFIGFLQAFVETSTEHRLLVSMRTDREPLLDAAPWAELRRLLSSGAEKTIFAPDPVDGLAEVVLGPARNAQVPVEPGLVKVLRRDVSSCEVWTPLVSNAMQSMVSKWKAMSDPTERAKGLTVHLYESEGGIHALLRNRTAKVMLDMDRQNKAWRRRLGDLFSLLVDISPEGQPVRRRPKPRDFAHDPELMALKSWLVGQSLLIEEESTELSHDKLLVLWPELRRWIKRNEVPLDDHNTAYMKFLKWQRRGRTGSKHLLLGREELKSAASLQDRLGGSGPVGDFKRFRLESEQACDVADLQRELVSGEPEYLILLGLSRSKMAPLDESTRQELSERARACYHALFPEHLPKSSPETGKASLSNSFSESDNSDDGPLSPQQLAWFNEKTLAGHERWMPGVHFFATLSGRIELLEHLQAMGVNLQRASLRGSTIGHWACEDHLLHVLQWLSTQTALAPLLTQVNNSNNQPIHFSAYYGQARATAYLLPLMAAPNVIGAEGYSMLQWACVSGNAETVQVLLDDPRVNIDAVGKGHHHPLTIALGQGHHAVARLLLNRFSDAQLQAHFPDEHQQTLLLYHLIGRPEPEALNRTSLLSELLDRGLDPNEATCKTLATPLILAVQYRRLAEVRELLRRGATVNARDTNGNTALHCCAQEFAASPEWELPDTANDILALLLAVPDIELDIPNLHGLTPLQALLFEGNATAVTMLLDQFRLRDQAPGEHHPSVLLLEAAMSVIDPDDPSTPGRLAKQVLNAGAQVPRWKSVMQADFTEHVTGLVGPNPQALLEEQVQHSQAAQFGWSHWPGVLLEGDWQDLTPEQFHLTLLHWIGPDHAAYSKARRYRFLHARRLALPFYPGGSLVEFAVDGLHDANKVGLLTLVETPSGVRQMEGKSPALHELNAKLNLKLSAKEEAALYLHTFCALVHGEGGAFNVVETQAHMAALLSEPHAEALAAIKPLKFIGEGPNEDGKHCFTFEATIKYANAIFLAKMEVQDSGMVTMMNDEPICADIPALCDRFEGDLRVRRAWVAQREE